MVERAGIEPTLINSQVDHVTKTVTPKLFGPRCWRTNPRLPRSVLVRNSKGLKSLSFRAPDWPRNRVSPTIRYGASGLIARFLVARVRLNKYSPKLVGPD